MLASRATRLRRRGTVLVYSTVAMVAFAGFVSLAVDAGRCRMVKRQLQQAADAAALYGVTGLPQGTTAAQNNAVAAAADNTADGTSVALDRQADIEFGTWDSSGRTFTVLTGSAQSSANAIRVTARRTSARGNAVSLFFAQLVGQNTSDVTTSAIAALKPTGHGIVGLGGITMSGNAYTDSYDSAAGPYTPGLGGSQGSVASNGDISLSGGATVHGDASPGPGETASGGTVTGSRLPLTTALNLPAVSAASYAASNDNSNVAPYLNNGSFNLSGGVAVVMPAGTYSFHDFTMSGGATLTITGPVTVYVTGKVDLSGSAQTPSSVPANFGVRVASTSNVTLSGGADFYIDLYAPQSAVTISGGAQLSGSVVGATLTQSGGAIHLDQSLMSGSGGSASLVN